jgi:hypothetical protein
VHAARAVNDSPRKGQGLIAIGPGLEIMVAEGQDLVEPHLGPGPGGTDQENRRGSIINANPAPQDIVTKGPRRGR